MPFELRRDGAGYEKVLDIVLRFRKSVLVGAFAGEVVSQIQEGDRMFDLLVRFDEDHRGSIDAIQNAAFNLENGTIVPLAELATIVSRSGPNTISRENVQRVITVSANVAGRDLRGTVDEIRSNISGSISFPQGYFVEYGGQFESEARANQPDPNAPGLVICCTVNPPNKKSCNYREIICLIVAILLPIVNATLSKIVLIEIFLS